MTPEQLQIKREKTRLWKLQNKERVAANNREYYQAHRDVISDRKRINDAHRTDPGFVKPNSTFEWSADHDSLILTSDLQDKELAELIGRSANAIKHRRVKLLARQSP